MTGLQAGEHPSKQEIARRHWLIIEIALTAADRMDTQQTSGNGLHTTQVNCTRCAESSGVAGQRYERLCEACKSQQEGVL